MLVVVAPIFSFPFQNAIFKTRWECKYIPFISVYNSFLLISCNNIYFTHWYHVILYTTPCTTDSLYNSLDALVFYMIIECTGILYNFWMHWYLIWHYSVDNLGFYIQINTIWRQCFLMIYKLCICTLNEYKHNKNINSTYRPWDCTWNSAAYGTSWYVQNQVCWSDLNIPGLKTKELMCFNYEHVH